MYQVSCLVFLTALVLSIDGKVYAASLLELLQGHGEGCHAVNAGALDLDVKVNLHGPVGGLMGSGFVTGLRRGDMLTFARKTRPGPTGLWNRVALAVVDHAGTGQIERVFALTEYVALAAEEPFHDEARYVIPAAGIGWSLFSSSAGEGEGEYSVTVRCVPESRPDEAPIS